MASDSAKGVEVQLTQDPSGLVEETRDPAERSLVEDLRLLAADARTLAAAELTYQKSRAGALGGGLGKIAGLGAIAALLAILALVALVVGLVFALTPILTAWGATAVVTIALLVLAAIMALWARASWTSLTTLLDEGSGQ